MEGSDKLPCHLQEVGGYLDLRLLPVFSFSLYKCNITAHVQYLLVQSNLGTKTEAGSLSTPRLYVDPKYPIFISVLLLSAVCVKALRVM